MTERLEAAWVRFAEWTGVLSDLAGTGALLGWDRETSMPPGGADTRARQLGTLSAVHHRELVRDDLEGTLELLRAHRDMLDPLRRRQLDLAVHMRSRALRTPEGLVRALSEARSRSVTVWADARPREDFARYAEAMGEVLTLSRRVAELLCDDGEPYDALLDDHEPGARAAELEGVFRDLTARLAPLAAAAERGAPPVLPQRHWPAEAQLELARRLSQMVGYDLDRGAIGVSAHPFTQSPGRGDVRFTTRIDTADPVVSVLTVLHEVGHALYEQGFPGRLAGTPVYDAPSMGAHESQSRFWENHLGRTRPFWDVLEPEMRALFGTAMDGVDAARLHRVATAVRPSLIRVEADEVTYNLHVALRFELEVAMFRGTMAVRDLPDAWDARMQELLGIRPERPSDGVMQDIHWAEGLFGYFPTYTLGNLYAAQLTEALEDALGPVPGLVADRRFADILGFMRDRVHRHGSVMPTRELMRRATGRELSADALVAHLGRVMAGTA